MKKDNNVLKFIKKKRINDNVFQNPKSVFANRIPEILNLEAGSWINNRKNDEFENVKTKF